MAKGQDLSKHQRGIVNRYYENIDTISLQKLQEIVSDLYLATSDTSRARLWKSARSAMERLKVDGATIDRIESGGDAAALAELAGRLSGTR